MDSPRRSPRIAKRKSDLPKERLPQAASGRNGSQTEEASSGKESDEEVEDESPLFVKPRTWTIGGRKLPVYLTQTKPKWLDTFLTFTCTALFIYCNMVLGISDLRFLRQLWIAMAACPVVIVTIKYIGPTVGRICSLENHWKKGKNRRKFVDQFWQLVIHAVMGVWELYVVRKENYWDPSTMWISSRTEAPFSVRCIYVSQLGIWFCTAFSHRFLEARHKDYFVMYAHHAVTIFLVTFSWSANYYAIGLLVLLIHDLTDVPLDMLKATNYLGLDEKSGFYIVEMSFVATAASWGYGRLWLFPRNVIGSIFLPYCDWNDPTFDCGRNPNVTFSCTIGLCMLLCMHTYWFTLLIRIAIVLIRRDDSHKAAAEMYEGESDDDEVGSGERGKKKKN